MSRFEKLKQMSIDELAEWLFSRNQLCEREVRCSKCEHKEWCDCTEIKDFKKWLEAEE